MPRSPRSAAERRKSFDQWIMDKDQQKEMEKQLKKQLAKQQTQGQNGAASANMQRRMSHVEWLEVKAVEDKIKKSESDEAKEREKQEKSFRDKSVISVIFCTIVIYFLFSTHCELQSL